MKFTWRQESCLMSPKSSSLYLNLDTILDRLSMKIPHSIETSSIMSTSSLVHQREAVLLHNLDHMSSILFSSISVPAKPCRVILFTRYAAEPVDAVTATEFGFLAYFSLSSVTAFDNTSDLLDLDTPVQNTDLVPLVHSLYTAKFQDLKSKKRYLTIFYHLKLDLKK